MVRGSCTSYPTQTRRRTRWCGRGSSAGTGTGWHPAASWSSPRLATTDPEQQRRCAQVLADYQAAGTTVVLRGREQITGLFAGFDIVNPGIVESRTGDPILNRSARPPPPSPGYGGVGKLRPRPLQQRAAHR